MGRLIKARERISDDDVLMLQDALERDGIVCMATDTVYGLNCLAGSSEALRRLAAVKGSGSRPFLLLIGEPGWLEGVAAEVPATARRLMARYWPGPLTLVLRASEGLNPKLRGKRGTVAVRQPGNPLCEQLLLSVGGPLASTSANTEGEPPCITGRSASEAFLERVDFVVDSGRAPRKQPSTIVDLTLSTPTVVREGALRVDADFLSELEVE
jgi:L-threonylcarbamoyladenylate synthase